MKKERNPITVILTMFFLSLFIILPPTFRSLIPKDETPITPDVPKLAIVRCSKIYSTELYQVISKTKFVDGLPVNNIITYEKLEKLPEDYTEPVQTADSTTPATTAAEELTYYKGIPNLSLTEEGAITTIVIDKKIINANPTEQYLKERLNISSSKQKIFYSDLGYHCNVMES